MNKSELKLNELYQCKLSNKIILIISIVEFNKTFAVQGIYYNDIIGNYNTIDIKDNQLQNIINTKSLKK